MLYYVKSPRHLITYQGQLYTAMQVKGDALPKIGAIVEYQGKVFHDLKVMVLPQPNESTFLKVDLPDY